MSSSVISHHIFWDAVSLWTWSSLIHLDWLASELQGYFCLQLHSTWVTGIKHCGQFAFTWALGITLGYSCLCTQHFAKGAISLAPCGKTGWWTSPRFLSSINLTSIDAIIQCFFLTFVWGRISLCSPGWPRAYHVAHAGLKVFILTLQPPKPWDHRCTPSYLDNFVFLFTSL